MEENVGSLSLSLVSVWKALSFFTSPFPAPLKDGE